MHLKLYAFIIDYIKILYANRKFSMEYEIRPIIYLLVSKSNLFANKVKAIIFIALRVPKAHKVFYQTRPHRSVNANTQENRKSMRQLQIMGITLERIPITIPVLVFWFVSQHHI